MTAITPCGPRRMLVTAIAVTLATLPLAAAAGTLTGPGSTHTVQPGDLREDWTVSDGAELTIAAGGLAGPTQVDNASVIGTDVDISGLFGIRVANAGSAAINGGTMTFTSTFADGGGVSSGSTMGINAVTVASAGRGFSATGDGSELTLTNTTVDTGGEALQLSDGALLVLDNVQATSVGTPGAGFGYALDIEGGTARVSNSTLTGSLSGVAMTGGALVMDASTIQSGSTALSMAGTGTSGPTATLSGSEVIGATGATVSRGASLTLAASQVRGTGTGSGTNNGMGVVLNNASLVVSQGSTVEGSSSALSITGNAAGNSTVVIDQSRLVSTTGPAIVMPLTGNADIRIANGSTVEAGNGVILQVAAGAVANLAVAGSNLVGDIVGQTRGLNSAEVNIALSEGASLTGTILNGAAVGLTDARWQMTGDSTVQDLSLGSGSLLELGDGSTFNTLQVAGDYVGGGGTLLFNTVLAGDESASDKLVIAGDSSGQTSVRVNNVGGAGAQTSQGISLIEVGGASNGAFDLAGRAVGGQYEYFLFKGTADGNWYLRSQAPDPCSVDPTLPGCVDPEPDPCAVDPTLPECVDPEPVPVLRPEPGAYLANLQAAEGMFRLGYHERHAGQNSGRAWVRVDGARSRFDADSSQLDVHGSSQALSVGTDLLRNTQGSAFGVMLSSGNASSTSTSTLTGYYARGKVRGAALGVYATWRAAADADADPYTGFYLDGSLQHARFSNRVEGAGLATEQYDSRAWQGALEVGHAFRIGGGGHGGVFLEPQLQVGYTRWSDVRHLEQNGTLVTSEDANGTFGRVGVRVSGVTRWQGTAASVQPYIAAHWIRTGADARVRMDDEPVDARIPRNRGEFSAGASLLFANGFGAWGGLSLQQGQGYFQRTAQIGLSYRW